MADPPLLRLEGVSKRFGDTVALDRAHLELQGGEVHALIGQNGSGKSTLIKALSGFHRPDPGARAWIDGEEVDLRSRPSLLRERMHFIHQSLNLVPELDALDNVALGVGFPTRWGRVRWQQHRHRTEEIVLGLGLEIDLDRPVGELSAVEQTVIAIARAMSDWTTARTILVLDEPTVSLPHAEVDYLFDTIRRVVDAGAAVLFVSHRLDEIFRLAARATVLREGRVVAMGEPLSGLNEDQLVERMLGRSLESLAEPVHPPRGEPICSIRDLRSEVLDGLSLDIHPGEIVGVAGLDGSGREELAELVFGARPRSGGTVTLRGREVPSSPAGAVRAGVGLVPADRLSKGCIPQMPVVENVTLPSLRRLTRWIGRIDTGREREEVEALMDQVDLQPPAIDRELSLFSGGNQQKAVIGKWLRMKPRLLILDEPAQGVDVGAKGTIFDLIRKAADEGMGVLVCSVDTGDLELLCDRVCVIRRGAIHSEFSGEALRSQSVAAQVLKEIEADA